MTLFPYILLFLSKKFEDLFSPHLATRRHDLPSPVLVEQDQDCYEVPVTRYTYVSPREWTGTWRLLIVCALAYAGLLAASILFDLIRLPVSLIPLLLPTVTPSSK